MSTSAQSAFEQLAARLNIDPAGCRARPLLEDVVVPAWSASYWCRFGPHQVTEISHVACVPAADLRPWEPYRLLVKLGPMTTLIDVPVVTSMEAFAATWATDETRADAVAAVAAAVRAAAAIAVATGADKAAVVHALQVLAASVDRLAAEVDGGVAGAAARLVSPCMLTDRDYALEIKITDGGPSLPADLHVRLAGTLFEPR